MRFGALVALCAPPIADGVGVPLSLLLAVCNACETRTPKKSIVLHRQKENCFAGVVVAAFPPLMLPFSFNCLLKRATMSKYVCIHALFLVFLRLHICKEKLKKKNEERRAKKHKQNNFNKCEFNEYMRCVGLCLIVVNMSV